MNQFLLLLLLFGAAALVAIFLPVSWLFLGGILLAATGFFVFLLMKGNPLDQNTRAKLAKLARTDMCSARRQANAIRNDFVSNLFSNATWTGIAALVLLLLAKALQTHTPELLINALAFLGTILAIGCLVTLSIGVYTSVSLNQIFKHKHSD